MRFKDYYYLCEGDIHDLYERRGDIYYNLIDEYRNRGSKNRQSWDVLDIKLVQSIWRDYMDNGRVRNRVGMKKITDLVIDNILKMSINTELTGHTSSNPTEAYSVDDYGEHYGFTEDDYENWGDWCEDEHGQPRISDYAMNTLEQKALDLISTDDEEEQLQIVDSVFNIVHQRSDLATYFVKGGVFDLDRLKNDED